MLVDAQGEHVYAISTSKVSDSFVVSLGFLCVRFRRRRPVAVTNLLSDHQIGLRRSTFFSSLGATCSILLVIDFSLSLSCVASYLVDGQGLSTGDTHTTRARLIYTFAGRPGKNPQPSFLSTRSISSACACNCLSPFSKRIGGHQLVTLFIFNPVSSVRDNRPNR